MPDYHAPLNDMEFLLKDWIDLESHYKNLGLEEFDWELIKEVISQGAKFASEVVAPLNQVGDEQSCSLIDGNVTTPEGFAAAYQDYINNGWNAMLGDEAFGGQQLPYTAAIPVHEMLNSANLSWRLVSMLTESAVLAVTKHGSDDLKQQYLSQLISGEWTGTMCLTEPQAGTDLALLNAKAEPLDDGSYAISGSKIFISGGDHEWTENILHLVLARLPDAPAGVKGISLFLVPKIMLDQQGQLNEPNKVSVGSIEKKMGIKGCPTCVMNFDDAKGFLIGEANNGLACMFTMMNDARFQVGIQGLGIAEAAYQGSLSYARDRLQSRAPQGVQQPDAKADAIIHQPDVRRMLLTQKSLTEGCRALSAIYAQQMDIERFGTEEEKSNANQIIAFLTPICKAFFTDIGQEVSQIGVQVYGGHGYIREWGMEQYIRDSRITLLYEGTNGIQSADLIGRKLVRDKGKMQQLTAELFDVIVTKIDDQTARQNAQELLTEWNDTSKSLLDLDRVEQAGSAHDYLQYSAFTLLGIIWISLTDKAQSSSIESIKLGKAKTCEFYLKRIMPRRLSHHKNLTDSVTDLTEISDQMFDYS